ncbi:MAG: hypothetical protein K6G87_12860 [Butyrivibrio sp.]|uniref:hypothetical protein n=1 Tax=Butyrivibrio sp. TaxID=28121 RepID=UPI0025D12760|nr:hypothetical protein [Butyrivibrio sp.]MCR5772103.1 hypothetical protein [Butyrivibrio sp.]
MNQSRIYSSENEYKDFTLSLALVDAIPVILFGISCIIIGASFNDHLFTVGAVLTISGGICKVLWKLFLATIHKNVYFLNRPLFIVLMPVGFIIMILSILINGILVDWKVLLYAFISFPAIIFFIMGILGLCAMTVFFKKHDKKDVKNNWIEQLTNCFSQTMILIGVIIVCH